VPKQRDGIMMVLSNHFISPGIYLIGDMNQITTIHDA
jgi:hypothetical protein